VSNRTSHLAGRRIVAAGGLDHVTPASCAQNMSLPEFVNGPTPGGGIISFPHHQVRGPERLSMIRWVLPSERPTASGSTTSTETCDKRAETSGPTTHDGPSCSVLRQRSSVGQ
jgi:hypothetical protein